MRTGDLQANVGGQERKVDDKHIQIKKNTTISFYQNPKQQTALSETK